MQIMVSKETRSCRFEKGIKRNNALGLPILDGRSSSLMSDCSMLIRFVDLLGRKWPTCLGSSGGDR